MERARRGKFYKKSLSIMSGALLAASMMKGNAVDQRQVDYMEPLDKPGYTILTHQQAGKELNVLNIPQRYVDIDKKKGVPGHIIVPDKIILHTTQVEGDDRPDKPAADYYRFFQEQIPADGKYGATTQFVVDPMGGALQLAELYENGIRRTYGCKGYYGGINIEVMHTTKFESKEEVPPAQFEKTVQIVIFAMKQYKIPLGSLNSEWKAKSNKNITKKKGIFGHQQLNPDDKWDPGKGFIKAVRDEVAKRTKQQTPIFPFNQDSKDLNQLTPRSLTPASK